ncbi:hypothetical protein XELAEV_18011857mg [Xenopus laevis]|uniref:Uncharacterized protein n=1 Tax=Xenopus laevis TaxID=8355 RepID=A0A974HXQ0_XENLA|nr:hypothetical protein XELAEV_18011857mg [Xenopus laevis]
MPKGHNSMPLNIHLRSSCTLENRVGLGPAGHWVWERERLRPASAAKYPTRSSSLAGPLVPPSRPSNPAAKMK